MLHGFLHEIWAEPGSDGRGWYDHIGPGTILTTVEMQAGKPLMISKQPFRTGNLPARTIGRRSERSRPCLHVRAAG